MTQQYVNNRLIILYFTEIPKLQYDLYKPDLNNIMCVPSKVMFTNLSILFESTRDNERQCYDALNAKVLKNICFSSIYDNVR